jgi:hypothetical protein
VKHSDLDWIVVRHAGLSKGDPKGIRIVKPETLEKVRFITRSDAEHLMLQQVDSSEYLHQAVGIANPKERHAAISLNCPASR